jgi:hypothetical protein
MYSYNLKLMNICNYPNVYSLTLSLGNPSAQVGYETVTKDDLPLAMVADVNLSAPLS